jgi:hypothetical protein
MKPFLLLSLLCSMTAVAQKDTTGNKDYLSGVSLSKAGSEIIVWSTGKITISGDSTFAIKLLWNRLAEAIRVDPTMRVTWKLDTFFSRNPLPQFDKLKKNKQ